MAVEAIRSGPLAFCLCQLLHYEPDDRGHDDNLKSSHLEGLLLLPWCYIPLLVDFYSPSLPLGLWLRGCRSVSGFLLQLTNMRSPLVPEKPQASPPVTQTFFQISSCSPVMADLSVDIGVLVFLCVLFSNYQLHRQSFSVQLSSGGASF